MDFYWCDKRLISGFSLGVGSDCYIKAHCFFGVRREKEFKVLKWFVNIFVLFLIEKCVS